MKTKAAAKPGLMTIVVARLVEDVEVIGTAQIDLGERHKTRPVHRAEAACWLNAGTEADLEKAKHWANTNGYNVFSYPSPEPAALAKARASLLSK